MIDKFTADDIGGSDTSTSTIDELLCTDVCGEHSVIAYDVVNTDSASCTCAVPAAPPPADPPPADPSPADPSPAAPPPAAPSPAATPPAATPPAALPSTTPTRNVIMYTPTPKDCSNIKYYCYSNIDSNISKIIESDTVLNTETNRCLTTQDCIGRCEGNIYIVNNEKYCVNCDENYYFNRNVIKCTQNSVTCPLGPYGKCLDLNESRDGAERVDYKSYTWTKATDANECELKNNIDNLIIPYCHTKCDQLGNYTTNVNRRRREVYCKKDPPEE